MYLFLCLLRSLPVFEARLIEQPVDDRFEQVKEDTAGDTEKCDADRACRDEMLDQVIDQTRNQVGDDQVDVDTGIHAAVDVVILLFIDAHEKTDCKDADRTDKDLRNDIEENKP